MSRITHLEATNWGGLAEVNITPGKATLITGENGVGKTSILGLVSAILTGKGFHPYLVTLGEDKATLMLKLDDGTTVKRTVKAPGKTSYLTVEKDGAKPLGPQNVINALLGPYACNPVEFFGLPAKEQGAAILALADMKDAIGATDYTALSGGVTLEDVDYLQHPLLVLAGIEKSLFEERTVINREKTQKTGAADELREKVPEGFDVDAAEKANLEGLVDKQAAARQQNKKVAEAAVELEKHRHLISALREQLENVEKMETDQSQWLADNPEIDTADLDNDIREFQVQQDVLRAHDGASDLRGEAMELSERSQKLTELLDALRDKPAELLAGLDELPIEGMGMDADHGVTINGIPLADLSGGEKFDLAVEIALRYAGDLPVLVVDGLEALDPKSQEQFREKLAASPCQVFVTKVSAGELVIEDWEAEDEDGDG